MTLDISGINATSLHNVETWVRAYESLAEQGLASIGPSTQNAHEVLTDQLNDACKQLISRQTTYLQDSDEYSNYKLAAGVGGLVPFGKTIVSHAKGRKFAGMALRLHGLADTEGLKALHDAFIKAQSTNKDLACKLSLNAGAITLEHYLELGDSLAEDVAVDTASELVHMKPIIGQLISMTFAYKRMDDKLTSILEKSAEKATEVHRQLVIPTVVFDILNKNTKKAGRHAFKVSSIPAELFQFKDSSLADVTTKWLKEKGQEKCVKIAASHVAEKLAAAATT
ncbi:uncharacterized protein F5Z01DRAFT_676478 [Emericellopsis atlantica]|uniref:Uncharacterized protein n=1 Tax=Emericellopsis atlantica TaxID=2614577 RepID=A0A9P7ZGZ1_9HYPO|nr:uncharacterized protein F5Z01DRAFT_676478 [Emericellopsis atlantica]KAG9251904.1 hypothetical protein F5Z01DRAFT_676478 [Emericellopsis atlantica]